MSSQTAIAGKLRKLARKHPAIAVDIAEALASLLDPTPDTLGPPFRIPDETLPHRPHVNGYTVNVKSRLPKPGNCGCGCDKTGDRCNAVGVVTKPERQKPAHNIDERVFLTVDQVADALGKSPTTVGTWCRFGRVACVKVARPGGGVPLWRIPVGEVERIRVCGLLPVDHPRP